MESALPGYAPALLTNNRLGWIIFESILGALDHWNLNPKVKKKL
jgi:hypothetical protein